MLTLLHRHHLTADEYFERLETLDVPRERLDERLFRQIRRTQMQVYQPSQVSRRGRQLQEMSAHISRGEYDGTHLDAPVSSPLAPHLSQ